MSIQVRDWVPGEQGELSVQAVRDLYPAPCHRVSELRGDPGEEFRGAMRAGEWFVLSGCCTVRFDEEIALRRGQVAAMPEGEYMLRVVGDEALHVAVAWKLPAPFGT